MKFQRKLEGKLDPEADELNSETLVDLVRGGKVDAYFVVPPSDLFARRFVPRVQRFLCAPAGTGWGEGLEVALLD